MGLILFLKTLFGATSFSTKLNTFNQLDERVQFFMFKELTVKYAKKYKPELADALAVQVIKYLMGHDLDAVRQGATPQIRNLIDSCKQNVEPEADKLMQSDPLINELVRRSLMTKFHLYSCLMGSELMQRTEGMNIETRIRRYDDSQPGQHHDLEKYIQCANRYMARVDAAERAES